MRDDLSTGFLANCSGLEEDPRALCSISGGGSSSQTKPWEAQQPYLKQIYKQAQGLYGGQPYEYGPSRVAEYGGTTNLALQGAEQRARAGSPLMRQAQQYGGDVMGGKYLDPSSNPYLEGTYNQAADAVTRRYQQAVLPTLRSRFEGAGRSGGGAAYAAEGGAQRQLGDSLSGLASDIYGGNYARERGLMQGMAGQAQGLADYDYRDLSALRNVGQQRDVQSQRVLDDIVSRFNYNQYQPRERLAEYSGFIGKPVQTQQQSSMNFGIMSCWVAAEYFGWFTPEWIAARRWLMELWQGERADNFRDFYVKHGRELAAEIRESDELREQWRPLFEWALEMGTA